MTIKHAGRQKVRQYDKTIRLTEREIQTDRDDMTTGQSGRQRVIETV